jgi:hypothetical protein
MGLRFAQEFQSLFDVGVGRIEFSSTLIGIESILDLVVARFI